MRSMVQEVRCLVNNNQLYSAIAMALTLPDICASLEAPNNKSDWSLYANWFDRYLSNKYVAINGSWNHGPIQPTIFFSGIQCYALRCSVLHNGSDKVSQQPVMRKAQSNLDKVIFSTMGSHKNLINVGGIQYVEINVKIFCNDICDGVNQWLLDNQNNCQVLGKLSNLFKIVTNSNEYPFITHI